VIARRAGCAIYLAADRIGTRRKIMRHGWRLIVLVLAVTVAVCAGCRRGGEQKPGTPGTPTSETTKPGPRVEPPGPPPQPPKVEPGDIAGKARVAFTFYLEKGPLTPKVSWDSSPGRLTVSIVHSSVNIGPRGNTRVASEKVGATSVRNLIAEFVKRTVEQLPEVKVLEVHVLFKGKDVGRLTASRREMQKAMAAADKSTDNVRGSQWIDLVIEKLPKAWVSPRLG